MRAFFRGVCLGNKKIIIRSVLTVAVVFVLFVVINKNAEISDNQKKLVFENKTEKTGFTGNSQSTDSRKVDFLAQSENSVSSGISAEPQNGIVPKIARFFQTGEMKEIRDIPRDKIKVAVEAYVSMQSRDQLAATLNQYLKMPDGLFSSLEKPEDYLMEMVDLIREDVDQFPRRSNVIITDSCAADGSILGNTHIIPHGTHRVFAVFENNDALQGMDSIYAVWRDLSDDTMTFSEYEPLHRNSAYNYVWLERKDGWPQGGYQLDLANAKSPSRILATTKFKVQ